MPERLLLQSCSSRKVEESAELPALERYDGYFFRIIKKAMNDGVFDPDIDLQILSAKHGLLDPKDPIKYYDQRMTPERAAVLRDELEPALDQLIHTGHYDTVVLNMASEYEAALDGFAEGQDVTVDRISGGGIGEKGHKLKQLIRTDKQSPKEL